MSPKKQQPETPIRKAVKQYLLAKGWFVFTVLQGLGAYPGISDLIAIKDGETVFIEIKTPTGKQSEPQIEFESRVRMAGGNYVVLRSLDHVMQWEASFWMQ